MAHRFKRLIPQTPSFNRNRYSIPQSYAARYEGEGISNADEQKTLFHGTQFGGFRVTRVPQYLQEKEGFLNEWFNSKKDYRHTSFKPNDRFLSRFGDIEIEPLLRNKYGNKKFKPELFAECGLSESEAREIQGIQNALNEFYSSIRVGISVPRSGIRTEDHMDLARFNSIPHFQYSPRSGNRLFHSGPGTSFQRISSSLRPFLTIDGQPTTEIDISAATIQFLNLALERYFGRAPIPKEALVSGDSYQPFLEKIEGSLGPMDRDPLKEVLYTLIYSPTTRQKSSVARKLRLLGEVAAYDHLEHLFPEFFDIVAKLKQVPLGEGNGTYTPQFSLPFDKQEFYPPHILIFREESAFARNVLERSCLEECFPVLPIHDSFVTPRSHGSRLEEIMAQVSQERYGYVLASKKKF